MTSDLHDPASSPPASPERGLPPRLLIPTVALYAAGYPIGAATVAVMSPFAVIALRFGLTALVAGGVLAARHIRPPRGAALGHVAVAGLLTQGVQFLGLYWALEHGVSAGLAALIVALNPVLTAALLAVVPGHRESVRGLVSLALGLAAVLLVCVPKVIVDHRAGPAVIAAVIGMLGLCLGGLYQARRCAGVPPLVVTAVGVGVSAPLAAVLALTTPQQVTDWPRAAVLLAVMVIASSLGGTTLYAACVARAGARAASILFALVPAVASVMSWFALGEPLPWLAVLALPLGAASCLVLGSAG